MQVKRWNDEFGLSLAVSINVSPLQLVDRDFLTNIKQICTDEKIDPSSIYLDISNEVIMGASIAAKEALTYFTVAYPKVRYGEKCSYADKDNYRACGFPGYQCGCCGR